MSHEVNGSHAEFIAAKVELQEQDLVEIQIEHARVLRASGALEIAEPIFLRSANYDSEAPYRPVVYRQTNHHGEHTIVLGGIRYIMTLPSLTSTDVRAGVSVQVFQELAGYRWPEKGFSDDHANTVASLIEGLELEKATDKLSYLAPDCASVNRPHMGIYKP